MCGQRVGDSGVVDGTQDFYHTTFGPGHADALLSGHTSARDSAKEGVPYF